MALGTDVNIIAIGDACEMVQKTLDREDVWDSWKGMTHAMVLIDGTCLADQLQNEDFKTFLAEASFRLSSISASFFSSSPPPLARCSKDN